MVCPASQIASDFGCIPTDPAGFVAKFYSVGLSIIGGIAVLGVIYGGYLLIWSRGNPLMLDKGKRYITSSIAGILLAFFAYIFIKIIAIDILHLPGFAN